MIARIMLMCVFVTLLFGAGAPVNTVPNNPNLALEFDHVAPETLYSIEIEINKTAAFLEADRLRQGWWVFAAHTDLPGTMRPMYDHVSALPDGTYWLRARVSNKAEVWSPWGEPISFVKAWDAPAAPTGCRWSIEFDVKPIPSTPEE